MLTYDLRRGGTRSLTDQLYGAVRADIERGQLHPRDKLPSKRALAQHLGVSVITVEAAYGQLLAEGFITSRQRSGYYVSDLAPYGPDMPGVPSQAAGGAECGRNGGHPALAADRAALKGMAEHTRRAAAPGAADAASAGAGTACALAPCGRDAGCAAPQLIADFSGQTPATNLFPYDQWAKTMRRALLENTERSLLSASQGQGSWALRLAIARYLRGSRAIEADPGQIVIGAGAQSLYQLVIQLLGPERVYAVEDPGYRRLGLIYRANRAQIVPCAVDASGFDPGHLGGARIGVVHCMPSHQYPTGLVMPMARRYELLGWAAQDSARFIIEDDYDCEFRLKGKPIPALQSIDRHESVIYLNTFTKSLGPAFRIGYAVLPWRLMQAYERHFSFLNNTVGALDQLTLTEFIESGGYERHVNRTRNHYRRVIEAFTAPLKSVDEHVLRPIGVGAGLHFLVQLGPQVSVEDVLLGAGQRGVRLSPLSDFRLGRQQMPGIGRYLVMDVSALALDNATQAAQILIDACASARAGAPAQPVDSQEESV